MDARHAILGKRGFLLVTGGLFVVSLAGHWAFAWEAYEDEQAELGQPAELRGFWMEVGRDTLENWQSEFLQLMWQVAGLAFLLHVGSPQSREGDDRKEEKLDRILEKLYGDEEAEETKRRLEKKFPKERPRSRRATGGRGL